MPPWRGWDDACTFLFDLGVHDAALRQDMRLQPREIRAVHWCTPSEVSLRAAAASARLLERIARAAPSEGTLYLEDAVSPL